MFLICFQGDHYNNSMPNVMQSFQDLDMKRIKEFKNLLIKSAEIERGVYPILIKCLDGIVRAAESVDEVAVSRLGQDAVGRHREMIALGQELGMGCYVGKGLVGVRFERSTTQ